MPPLTVVVVEDQGRQPNTAVHLEKGRICNKIKWNLFSFGKQHFGVHFHALAAKTLEHRFGGSAQGRFLCTATVVRPWNDHGKRPGLQATRWQRPAVSSLENGWGRWNSELYCGGDALINIRDVVKWDRTLVCPRLPSTKGPGFSQSFNSPRTRWFTS